eukprot:944586_1
MAQSLPFHKQIFVECLQNDGLCVMARGLGIFEVLYKFVKFCCDPSKLCVVLNLSPDDERRVQERLVADGHPSRLRVVNSDSPATERQRLYVNGGCLSITSRILIVDLLNKVLPAESLTGVLVHHAERVAEMSQSAFILRLFRERNKNGFVKAFSSYPEQFRRGFQKVQKVMRCLFVTKLYLWPRFRLTISDSLEKFGPEVIEMAQPLTPAMKGIQDAIVEIMNSCLIEIRRVAKIDIADFSLESGLLKSFDLVLKRELDPIWHKLRPQTKQMVNDLKTLRTLLFYLLSYDCVIFHRFLLSLRTSSAHLHSPWLVSRGANKMFKLAKLRVYSTSIPPVKVPSKKARKPAQPPQKDGAEIPDKKRKRTESEREIREKALKDCSLRLNLEENSKWSCVRQCLSEISEEHSKSGISPRPTVIFASDAQTCTQLSEYLSEGSEAMLKRRWRVLLNAHYAEPRALQPMSTGEFTERQRERMLLWSAREQIEKRLTKPKDGRIQTTLTKFSKSESPSTSSRDTGKMEMDLTSEIEEVGQIVPAEQLSVPSGDKNSQKSQNSLKSEEPVIDLTEEAESGSDSEKLMSEKPGSESEKPVVAEDSGESLEDEDDWAVLTQSASESRISGEDSSSLLEILSGPQILIHPTEDATSILRQVQPEFIIVYDPNLKLIREIETYTACHPNSRVRVYFLTYEDSVESQRYQTSVQRERDSFEGLIREKAEMVIPRGQDGKGDEMVDSSLTVPKVSMRKGGRDSEPERQRVIVDMREFRSSLPSMLHASGIDVVPVTLEVGDYILSPDLCVERKSVPDLLGSLASGRLHSQLQSMRRHYRFPVLLIEFAERGAFALCSRAPLPADIRAHHVISKLCLVVLHFPETRLVWSRHARATASIFTALKKARPQPNTERAAVVGTGAAGSEEDMTAEDILRKLPGVTRDNFRYLRSEIRCLADLCKFSARELAQLLGRTNGRKLYEFIHARNVFEEGD